MKKIVILVFSVSFLLACSNRQTSIQSSDSTDQYTPPAPNTIVARDSMPIIEDKLNNTHFSVKVVSGANSGSKGTYAVEAAWGFNEAKGEFTMPAGGEHLKPVMKKGAEPYTYIIGFNYGKDNAFNEYFEVSGGKTKMEMKYIKVYSFK